MLKWLNKTLNKGNKRYFVIATEWQVLYADNSTQSGKMEIDFVSDNGEFPNRDKISEKVSKLVASSPFKRFDCINSIMELNKEDFNDYYGIS